MTNIQLSFSPVSVEVRQKPRNTHLIEITLGGVGHSVCIELPRRAVDDIIEAMRGIEEIEDQEREAREQEHRKQMALFHRMGEPL